MADLEILSWGGQILIYFLIVVVLCYYYVGVELAMQQEQKRNGKRDELKDGEKQIMLY